MKNMKDIFHNLMRILNKEWKIMKSKQKPDLKKKTQKKLINLKNNLMIPALNSTSKFKEIRKLKNNIKKFLSKKEHLKAIPQNKSNYQKAKKETQKLKSKNYKLDLMKSLIQAKPLKLSVKPDNPSW